MTADRDVAAFDQRATNYEQGLLGRMHHDIAERTASIALSSHPTPGAVLDVGCGTGYLLRLLASRCPNTNELVGIDPAESMVAAARSLTSDPRVVTRAASAERIPYPNDSFDLVISTTSFDHWVDQAAGLRECRRVLASSGHRAGGVIRVSRGPTSPTRAWAPGCISRSGRAWSQRRCSQRRCGRSSPSDVAR